MEKIPNISVIIPVYNKEEYLDKCLQSIINQTYQDLEIIIVNDGSKDKSREICERYEEQDKRIRLINTENRGAGSARNTGIEESRGNYLSLVDADDYICHDYYERLYNMIQKYDADIAEGHYKGVKEYDETIFTNTGHEKQCTNMEKLLVLYGEDESEYINSVIVTNKLYNRRLLDKTKYPDIRRLIDDEFVTYHWIYDSKKVVVTDDIMYGYVLSDASVMRANFKEKRVYDTMDAYDEVYKFFLDKGNKELIGKIIIRYLSYCGELAEKTEASQYIEDKLKIYQYLNEKFEEKSQVAKDMLDAKDYESLYNRFRKIVKE